jgi:hypothetical protein
VDDEPLLFSDRRSDFILSCERSASEFNGGLESLLTRENEIYSNSMWTTKLLITPKISCS